MDSLIGKSVAVLLEGDAERFGRVVDHLVGALLDYSILVQWFEPFSPGWETEWVSPFEISGIED